MNILEALLLGLLQGLTEFLPVSSSGHLVIVQQLLPNFSQPGLIFDTVIHAGTTLAVLFYFREKILKISREYILLLIIGTIPAVIVGVLFSDFIEGLFNSVIVVGVALIITAVLNYFTDKADARREKIGRIDALIVGVFQSIAIVPGISRSGSTIFAGTSMGLTRSKAAEFSFLMSVPAIIGANFWEIYKHGINGGLSVWIYTVGFLAAFISGIFAIGIVLRALGGKNFKFFALYCAIIGLVSLFLL
jgi:undecaprenyl-diphosphatase